MKPVTRARLAWAIGSAILAGLPILAVACSVRSETITGRACVHDGDTLRIGAMAYGRQCRGGVPVRIKGIAAPELWDHAKSEPEAQLGEAARLHLQQLIDGRPVRCDLTDEHSYDRRVGYCYVATPGYADIDLGAEQVRIGFAYDCRRYSGGRYADLEQRIDYLQQVYPRPEYCR